MTVGPPPSAARSAWAPRARRGGLVDEIVSSLTTAIRSRELREADRLPTESALVARFQVSRTVVREALSKLQAAGLVQTRHGVGTFVKAPPPASANFRLTPEDLATVHDVISVLELRIPLESESAGLAAQRRSPAQLAAMRAALAAYAQAIGDGSDAAPNDFQFHFEVARATGNRHFIDLMSDLGTMLIPRTRVNTPSQAPEGRSAYLQRVHAEHERILAAIETQDSRGASAAMRRHLSNSKERLRRRAQAEAV